MPEHTETPPGTHGTKRIRFSALATVRHGIFLADKTCTSCGIDVQAHSPTPEGELVRLSIDFDGDSTPGFNLLNYVLNCESKYEERVDQ